MTHPHDNIRVGAITFVYSITKRGWVLRDPLIISPKRNHV
ncbi:DUF1317 family protein [Escherichia coli]|nr:DUF1317 family protein [Escherichia coli]